MTTNNAWWRFGPRRDPVFEKFKELAARKAQADQFASLGERGTGERIRNPNLPPDPNDPFGLKRRAEEAEAQGTTLFQQRKAITGFEAYQNIVEASASTLTEAAQRLIPGEQQLERLTKEVGPFQAWKQSDFPAARVPVLPVKVPLPKGRSFRGVDIGVKGALELAADPLNVLPVVGFGKEIGAGARLLGRASKRATEEALATVSKRAPALRTALESQRGFLRLGRIPDDDVDGLLAQLDDFIRRPDEITEPPGGGLAEAFADTPANSIAQLVNDIDAMSARVEGMVTAKVVRPRWATGLTNEQLLEIARREGRNPYGSSDWGDAIDMETVRMVRTGFKGATSGQSLTSLRGELAAMKRALRGLQAEPSVRLPRAEPGTPEAGVQAGMGGAPDTTVTPAGKGVRTQVSMDDQLKLQQARAPQPLPVTGAAKEPWQMTRAEFKDAFWFTGRKPSKSFETLPLRGGIAMDYAPARSYAGNPLPGALGRKVEGGKVFLLRVADLHPDLQKEMMREWNAKIPRQISRVSNELPNPADYPNVGEGIPASVDDPHAYLVKKALSEGKPVPAEVLAEYPNLAKAVPTQPVAPVTETVVPPRRARVPSRKPVAEVAPETPTVPGEGLAGVSPPSPARTPLASGAAVPTAPPAARAAGEGLGTPPRFVGTAGKGAGEPPVIPPAEIEPPITPGQPSPSATDRALNIARAIIKRDRPGVVTRLLDATPVLRQLQRRFHRSLEMKEDILAGWIAEGNVRGVVATDFTMVRAPALRRLDAVFRPEVVRGQKKSTLRFLGTAEQANYSATGTFYDIAQNPHLYDLSPVERSAIQEASKALDGAFQKVRADYGLEIGRFQTKPGAMFLSNIEKPQVGKELFAEQARTAGRSSRAKTRFYETGRERWEHDNTFNPITDVAYLLGAEMHEAVAGMAGKSVYKTAIGGLTRAEALRVTGHAGLVKEMDALRGRLQSLLGSRARLSEKQADAIDDFLASSLEDSDLLALRDGLEPVISRGPRKGKDILALEKEIRVTREAIAGLRPAWKVANAKGYQFVQEGVYRYFPDEDAAQIKRLAERPTSGLWQFIDNVRATAFGGDLSPTTVQGSVVWLSDPVGVSREVIRQITKGKGIWAPYKQQALFDDLVENADSWRRFTEATGMQALGTVDREFSVGFIGKIPGIWKVPSIGKIWTEFNESVYRPVMRHAKDVFDSSYEGAIRLGRSEEEAMAIAADDATKIVPRISGRRLGWSEAEQASRRALLTSISFLTQPTALMSDAVTAMVKLGTKQTITPSEAFALRRVGTLVATTEVLAVTSSVYFAWKHGQDMEQAALEALDPTHPNFMSIKTPWGARIGLGGPYRSLIRAVVPRKVEGVDFPMPFAGVHRFALSKLGPLPRIAYDEIRNVDFYGKQIRSGEFPKNVLQGIAYAVTGGLPLTAGSAIRSWQQGEGRGRTLEELSSQFGGTNYVPFDPIYDAKLRWEDDIERYEAIPTDTLKRLALGVSTRDKYRKSHPDVDAKLFIVGKVSSLQTARAVNEALALIRKNDIDPDAIKAIKARKQLQKDYAKLGRRLERNEVDRLIERLEQGEQQPAPSRPTATPASVPSSFSDPLGRTKAPTTSQPTPSSFQQLLERSKEPVGAR